MNATPNLDEAKASTESGTLADAFRLIISHDQAEEKSLIARLGEESSQLRAVIEKKEQTINEALTAYPRTNEVAATGHAALSEIQLKDRMKIDLLAQLLVLCRQSLEQKDDFLDHIDEVDDSDAED